MSMANSMQSHGRALPPCAWVLALLLGLVLPGAASAAELRTGEVVVVGPGEVIDDDLYAFAREVDIQGTVRGDVVTAARRVSIRGTVEGDVLSAARETEVSGPVQGSLRSATEELDLGGPVGKDALIAGNRVRLLQGGNIPGDVFVAGNEVSLQAPVGGDVQAAAQKLTLGAPVEGSVRAEVGELRLDEGARIGGDLRYTAQRPAVVPADRVEGRVEQLPARERDEGVGVLGFLFLWARSIIGLFALGLLLAFLAPRLAERAPAMLREQPGRSLGWGVVAFVAAPAVGLLLFIVGMLVGGWWLGVFALGFYALALLLSFPVVGLLIGRWLLAKSGRPGASAVLALLVGIVLLAFARRLPYFGGIAALVTMFFGTGALLLALRRQRGPTPPVPA